MSRELYVVGIGVDTPRHLTQEAYSTLRSAEKVLALCGDIQELKDVLGDSVTVVDLMPYYQDGRTDDENYLCLAKSIRRELSTEKTALAISGHPLFGVSWIRDVLQSQVGVTVRYVDGVSSWAGMLTQLGIDPIERGSTLLDVNRMLLFDVPLDPCLDVYIFSICSIATRVVAKRSTDLCNWQLLVDHLRKFYPNDHLISVVHCASAAADPPEVATRPLAKFDELIPHVDYSTSLFVPAMDPSSFNKETLRLLLGQ